MEQTLDINYINLFMGYLLVLIPVIIFYHYKTGLIKDSLIAVVRMTVQLLVVGLYLEILFEYNKVWINSLWWILMVIIATFTIIRRAYLSRRYFMIPLALSLLASLAIVDAYFLGIIIDLDYFFDARYFIPISGIILGNCLKTNILGLNTFYKTIQQEKVRYRYYLANGASHGEALAPFMREALKTAFNPLIATITVIGLISLPGLMTGQILGGSSPEVAIKYQLMLMLSLFASTLISVVLTIIIANRLVFDEYGNMKENVIKKNKNNSR